MIYKLCGAILLMFFALNSCKPDFEPATMEGVLSFIPDSLESIVLPLAGFFIDELQTQCSYQVGLFHENGKSIPVHGNVGLSRDSLDRLILEGWKIKVVTVAD